MFTVTVSWAGMFSCLLSVITAVISIRGAILRGSFGALIFPNIKFKFSLYDVQGRAIGGFEDQQAGNKKERFPLHS